MDNPEAIQKITDAAKEKEQIQVYTFLPYKGKTLAIQKITDAAKEKN